MKILVVDDSKSIRSLIDFSLSDFETIEITEAENGKVALELTEDNIFDLIITDVNMPEMGGIEFTTRCRKENSVTCPILILTTEDEDHMKRKGKSAGANGWIVKPFAPESLVETMRKFIDF